MLNVSEPSPCNPTGKKTHLLFKKPIPTIGTRSPVCSWITLFTSVGPRYDLIGPMTSNLESFSPHDWISRNSHRRNIKIHLIAEPRVPAARASDGYTWYPDAGLTSGVVAPSCMSRTSLLSGLSSATLSVAVIYASVHHMSIILQ